MKQYRGSSQRGIISGLTILLIGLVLTSCGAAQQLVQSSSGQSSSNLQGTDLGKSVAPDFHLVDQYDQPITLSQFKGMPVILTFFYTRCPNFCPLIAEKIHATLVQLGPNAQQVAILAISADPSGDTPSSVATFSQEHQLQGYAHWHYLLGTRQILSPLWASYHVAGVPPQAKMMSVSAMQHSAVVYVIDQQGRERVLLDSDFKPAQLTQDLQAFLKSHS
jgi:protein SCO1/2